MLFGGERKDVADGGGDELRIRIGRQFRQFLLELVEENGTCDGNAEVASQELRKGDQGCALGNEVSEAHARVVLMDGDDAMVEACADARAVQDLVTDERACRQRIFEREDESRSDGGQDRSGEDEEPIVLEVL